MGEVVEGFVQMLLESAEAAEQVIGHPRLLQVLPEPLDEVQLWAVMRQPEGLNVLSDILEVIMERLGMVRLALIQNRDDPPPGPASTGNQLLQ